MKYTNAKIDPHRQGDLLYSRDGFRGRNPGFGLAVEVQSNIYNDLLYYYEQDGASTVNREFRVNITPCAPENIYRNSITPQQFIDMYERAVSNVSIEASYNGQSGGTMTFELNTNVLPVVSVDLYSRQDMLYQYEEDFSFKDLDDAIMNIATPIIEDTISWILPSAKVAPTSVSHPQFYNYGGDELNFRLSFSAFEYEALKTETLADSAFESFLQANYRSYDGFISYLASDLQAFEEQEEWKQVVQVIMFHIDDNQYNTNSRDFEYDLMEYLDETYTIIDEYDEEGEEL